MSQVNSVNGNTLLFTGFFPPCRAGTTAAITLAGLQTIDTVALASGDRVLVWNQADQTTNGIYAASSGNWVRTSDALSNTQFYDGMAVLVAQGAQNAQQIFLCTTLDDPVIIGTSLLTFASLTALNTISAAMKPVTAAPTLALARAAMGLGSAALENVGRYGVADDGAGFLRPSGPISSVSTTQGVTALNHNATYTLSGAVTFNLAQSSALWNGFRIKLFTPAGATGTVTPTAGDQFSGLVVSASLSVPSGRLTEITTDGAGNWFATPAAGWQNAPIAISGATPVTNNHDGMTLELGGGGFYALTFPAGSTLHSNFTCVVVNTESTAVGKGIAGVAGNFTLYPGESYLVYNDNNTLRLLGGGVKRYKVSSIGLFVDGANGSDDPTVADGLSTGARAFKTIGAAITALFSNFDHNKSFPTITIAAGTYNESITISGALIGATLFFLNGASPVTFGGAGGAFSAGVQWQPAGAGTPYCIIDGDFGCFEWSNIYFNGGGINSTAIQMHQGSVCDQNGGGGFGSMGSGGHVATDGCGPTYNINASYNVVGAGGAAVHLGLTGLAQLNHAGSVTVTIGTGAAQPNIGKWLSTFGGLFALGNNINWVNSPLAGCQKWNCGPGGNISLGVGNAANVPGSVAGSPAVGSAPAAGNGWVN